MFIVTRIHCVCKQKQIYFFPFGARITDALVLCVLYFPEMRHTEELCRIRKEEGSLATEFDIETYSGQGIRHPK
jgi:hypothetical protein